jgi:hypothetical protein
MPSYPSPVTSLVPAVVREKAKAAGAAAWLDALPELVTDPNSGPLLFLIAAAFWPRRQR